MGNMNRGNKNKNREIGRIGSHENRSHRIGVSQQILTGPNKIWVNRGASGSSRAGVSSGENIGATVICGMDSQEKSHLSQRAAFPSSRREGGAAAFGRRAGSSRVVG